MERDKDHNTDLYSKVNRKPTPHKKHKRRQGEVFVTNIEVQQRHSGDQEPLLHHIEHPGRGKQNMTGLKCLNL